MRHEYSSIIRVVLLASIWLIWWWAISTSLSIVVDLIIIIGGVLLTFPLIWYGRKQLDQHPTLNHTTWITTLIHYALGITIGIPIIRAIISHQNWIGWVLPVPTEIGLVLVIISAGGFLLTVINLALKGLGAPFAIALSQKLAVDWMYAWTRNPMVLTVLALLLSLGIWFRSVLFVLWVLIIFTPAMLYFLKVFEERELEIRFGGAYLEYKAKTPMLFPRRPKG